MISVRLQKLTNNGVQLVLLIYLINILAISFSFLLNFCFIIWFILYMRFSFSLISCCVYYFVIVLQLLGLHQPVLLAYTIVQNYYIRVLITMIRKNIKQKQGYSGCLSSTLYLNYTCIASKSKVSEVCSKKNISTSYKIDNAAIVDII